MNDTTKTAPKAKLYFSAESGKWTAEYNGHILAASYGKEYVIEKIRGKDCRRALKYNISDVEEVGEFRTPNAGVEYLPISAPVDDEDEAMDFDINTRFGFLETLVQMTVDRTIPSLLITGEGGLGKTFMVKKVIKDNNLDDVANHAAARAELEIKIEKEKATAEEKEKANKKRRGKKTADDEEEEEDAGVKGLAKVETMLAESRQLAKAGDFIFVKGYSTPKALYRILYENNSKLIIFDDCDSIQKDANAVNLIKAAADSYDERWVSWYSESPFSDLPTSFKFEGRIIFISNLSYHKVDQAIRSRSMCVDLSMTLDQKLERMANIIESADFMASEAAATIDHKREALAFLKDKKNAVRDLTLRSLISVVKIRMSEKPNWRELAEYILRTN